MEDLRWDDVEIHHDARKPPKTIDAWFERWFDPEDNRLDKQAEFVNSIHSLSVEPHRVSADFGSAPARALLELLSLLEKHGARNIRISSSRDEAEEENLVAP